MSNIVPSQVKLSIRQIFEKFLCKSNHFKSDAYIGTVSRIGLNEFGFKYRQLKPIGNCNLCTKHSAYVELNSQSIYSRISAIENSVKKFAHGTSICNAVYVAAVAAAAAVVVIVIAAR